MSRAQGSRTRAVESQNRAKPADETFYVISKSLLALFIYTLAMKIFFFNFQGVYGKANLK